MTNPLVRVAASEERPVKATPYQEHLWRMANRIWARGGSDADVVTYLRHAAQNEKALRAAIEPTSSPDVAVPGMIQGISQQLLQGVTFGFGDEALGTLYGLLSGEGGQEGRDLYRAQLSLFRQANPKTALAANVLGAAALPVGVAGRALASGGKLAAGAIGAGAAALAGAGEAEGGLSERAKQALQAAPFGFALGAAAPAVGSLAAKTARAVSQSGAGRAVQQVVAKVTPSAQRLFSGLIERLPGSPQRAARQAIAATLKEDGLTATAAAARVEQRAAHGLPTTLADVTGDHTVGLAIQAQQYRTPAQQSLVQRLTAREADKGARLLGAIGNGSRLGLQNAYELGDQLIAQRTAAAAPHYLEAFAQEAQVTPTIRAALQNPIFQQAYANGRVTAMAEDVAGFARGAQVPELAADAATLPVRGLDYMKRELDVMIGRAGQEGRPPLSRQSADALRAQLNKVLDEVSEQVPSYRQARQVFAGYSQKIEALRQGADGFLNKAPEVIRREIAASGAPEMYRIGALQTLADAVHGMGTETGNVAERLMGARLYGTLAERSDAARIRTLFDSPSAAEDFLDRLAGEAASTRVSKTPLGQRGVAQPMEATRRFAPPGRVRRFTEAQGLTDPETRIARGRNVANEITMLFTKGLDDPNELVALLHSLDALEAPARAATAGTRVGVGSLGAQIEQR